MVITPRWCSLTQMLTVVTVLFSALCCPVNRLPRYVMNYGFYCYKSCPGGVIVQMFVRAPTRHCYRPFPGPPLPPTTRKSWRPLVSASRSSAVTMATSASLGTAMPRCWRPRPSTIRASCASSGVSRASGRCSSRTRWFRPSSTSSSSERCNSPTSWNPFWCTQSLRSIPGCRSTTSCPRDPLTPRDSPRDRRISGATSSYRSSHASSGDSRSTFSPRWWVSYLLYIFCCSFCSPNRLGSARASRGA